MVLKRKTVSALSMKVAKANLKEAAEESSDAEGQIVAVEEKKEISERDLVVARTKELKAMGAAELKEVLVSNGLATGTKEVMITALLKHEAKARKTAAEQKSKIRAVVVKKKQELEGLSTSELSKLCDNMSIKGLRSKEERVQRLLVQWQEADGVDKALAKIAEDERKEELDAMDSTKLQKLCNKMGVDPFVKEIMVERISKRENETGRYSRPRVMEGDDSSKGEDKGDMVEALLANEAQRKKEKEIKSQQEETLLNKRKELKSMSVEDLKKRLTKRGLEASGKKEEMVEALFIAVVQEEAANTRKEELKSKSLQELKELVSRTGLETGSKEQMLKTLLAHEAKQREDLKAFDAKVDEMAEKMEEDLDNKTNAALKDMCSKKGLAVGGSKEDRIERLVEEAQKEGALDKVVSKDLREKRKDELMSMPKPAVVQLCEKAAIDPIVKDIMVERILMQESEGDKAIAMADAEPAAKRRKK